MATTGRTGNSNMRQEYDSVNPDCKRQEFWRNREVGWSSVTFARLTQRGVLTPKEAVALLLGLERTDFTPSQILKAAIPVDGNGKPIEGAKLATNKNAIGSLLRKFGDKGLGLITTKQKPNHSRRLPGIYEPTRELFSRFQIPIRAHKELRVSTQSSLVPEQYVQTPPPPEAPKTKGHESTPKGKYRFPGFPKKRGANLNPEIVELAKLIDELPGKELAQPQSLERSLSNASLSIAEARRIVADVALVVRGRRAATNGRACVWKCITVIETRMEFARKAENIRAQSSAKPPASKGPQPDSVPSRPSQDQIQDLATTFELKGVRKLRETILPEAAGDLGKAKNIAKFALQSGKPIMGWHKDPAAFVFTLLTDQTLWRKTCSHPKVLAALAEWTSASKAMERSGIPFRKDALPLVAKWKKLIASRPSPESAGYLEHHDQERAARAAVFTLARSTFSPGLRKLIDFSLYHRLLRAEMKPQSMVWKRAMNHHRDRSIMAFCPWVPVEVNDPVAKRSVRFERTALLPPRAKTVRRKR